MRVFLTGASGYFGAVLTEHLIRGGHRVSALVRSDAAREKVARLGAEPVPGSLADLEVLRAAAAEADGVVHAAVDFADPAMHEIEQPALAAMLDATKPGRPFVYTSTGLVYPDTHGAQVDEDSPVAPEQSPQPFKVLGERRVLAAEGPAVTVVRASLIYGRGGSGLLRGMIAGAREHGVATYIGTGANAWSSVHVDDLARLHASALVAAEPRLVVNASAGTPTSMRDIAEAVAELTGAQAMSITLEQAREAMGPYADVLTRSAPLNSARAGRMLGWTPVEAGLPAELRKGSYTRM
ncbi:nucleoside-diphosphate-sugar epimerase [Catenulispora sp. EB89]|uniref:NAD-dependent epimerase/dehydratase family protein n=1 Tax=Catenulispora sp. EB89 TaxID=3156257 RepID=UPI0035110CE4